ncbi:hypothetical protein ACBP82_02490 [Paenalcaligenes hominis]|uniref:hypothetical protein n=1 Tax=Paenalcaligenes hominis TaxID=643674 RepID=UPI003523A794
MSLVLGAGAYCNWIEALPVLAVVGFNEGQARAIELNLTQDTLRQALAQPYSVVLQSTEQLQLLAQELTQYPQQKVILLYSDLPQLLEGLIKTNHDIAEALEQWKTNLLALQDFYRMHRKQTLLFDLSQVLSHPHHFVEVCKQHGVSTLDTAAVDVVVHDAAKPWASTLAQQILLQDPDLAQVVQYTKAMTWPLTSEDSAVSDADVLGILAVLRQLQSTSAVEKELVYTQTKLAAQHEEKQNLLQENQLVLQQLSVAQEQLEKKSLAMQSAEQELLQLKNMYQQYVELERDSQAHKNTLDQENQLVLEQLFVAQEELEKKSLALQNTEQELSQLRQTHQKFVDLERNSQTQLKKITALETKLAEELASNQANQEQLQAEKATLNAQLIELKAQLHTAQSDVDQSEKKVVELQLEKNALAQENQLVLEQLLTVQAELETLILAKETSLALQKELGAENTLLLQQLHSHQEELERIYLKDKDATTNPDRQVPVVLDHNKESSTDLVVVSEVRVHEPEHTVPPKSFFERRAARKARRDALRKDKERAQHIVQSPWFDAQWYLQQYPDVAQDPVQSANPALHYIRLGGFEGRNPSPYFDSSFYLESNPDVAITGINPLWHFLRNGQAEGRQPHP